MRKHGSRLLRWGRLMNTSVWGKMKHTQTYICANNEKVAFNTSNSRAAVMFLEKLSDIWG